MALFVAGRLLRRAAQVNRSGNGAVFGIDDRDIGGFVAEDIHPFGGRFKENAIRSAFDFDFLDGFQRRCIKHRHWISAAESVMSLGIDRHAVSSALFHLTDGFKGIEIKDQNLIAARNIKPAAVVVGIDIINAASAHGLRAIDDLVSVRSGSKSS
jgi:hypothetical protein